MRVGLNATCLNDRPSGARQRFIGIYGALIAARPETEFVIYEPADCAVAGWFAGATNITGVRTPVPSSGRLGPIPSLLGYWRRRLRRDRLDLLESFNLPLVAAPDCPTILTIHDIRYTHPDIAQPRRAINRLILRRALRAADTVIAVSDTIAGEIRKFHPAAPVVRIYNGIAPAPFVAANPPHIAALRARLNLKADFVLAVGHFEPRKNYPVLVDAFARLAARGTALDLVIVGNGSGERAAVAAQIAALGLAARVHLLSNVPDDDLRALYGMAALVVVPSLYEGFGIALLEAMAAHRPLVVSDIPVFRELLGPHGVFFSPYDADACATQMAALLGDPARAAAQVAAGDRRLGDFTFTRLAEQVGALHDRIAARRARS